MKVSLWIVKIIWSNTLCIFKLHLNYNGIFGTLRRTVITLLFLRITFSHQSNIFLFWIRKFVIQGYSRSSKSHIICLTICEKWKTMVNLTLQCYPRELCHYCHLYTVLHVTLIITWLISVSHTAPRNRDIFKNGTPQNSINLLKISLKL